MPGYAWVHSGDEALSLPPGLRVQWGVGQTHPQTVMTQSGQGWDGGFLEGFKEGFLEEGTSKLRRGDWGLCQSFLVSSP